MTNKLYTLIIFLLIGIVGSSAAQSTDQASMRVSARVVSGASVDFEQQSEFVAMSKGTSSSLGRFVLKGIKKDTNVLVYNSDKINLKNSEGHEVTMDIESRQQAEGSDRNIHYDGKFSEDMVTSTYQGELKTTIAYN